MLTELSGFVAGLYNGTSWSGLVVRQKQMSVMRGGVESQKEVVDMETQPRLC